MSSAAFETLDRCGADAELIAITKKCLQTAAKDRYACASLLSQTVAEYRQNVAARLRQAETDHARAETQAAEQRKRRRIQYALIAAVLLLIFVGASGAVLASLWRTSEANRAEALLQRDSADRAKADALEQKHLAEMARRVAEKATNREAALRREVEQQREKLAIVEYGRRIEIAQHECFANNPIAARDLPTSTRNDFRKWEWHYVNHLANSGLLFNSQGSQRQCQFCLVQSRW